MSRYQSASARLALTSQVRAHLAQLPVLESCTSAQMQDVAERLAAGMATTTNITDVDDARAILSDPYLSGLARNAGQEAVTNLAHVHGLIGGTGTVGATATPRPRVLERQLRDATADLFADLAPVLARGERDVVALQAAASLRALDYTVIHESGVNADGIEARYGNELMLVAVSDGGLIDTDHAGVEGSCGLRQARFEREMARRGVALTETGRLGHGEGSGPLIAPAAAKRERSLALAIARHAVDAAPNRAYRPRSGPHRPRAAQSGPPQSTPVRVERTVVDQGAR